jgi:hypothetical protein
MKMANRAGVKPIDTLSAMAETMGPPDVSQDFMAEASDVDVNQPTV